MKTFTLPKLRVEGPKAEEIAQTITTLFFEKGLPLKDIYNYPNELMDQFYNIAYNIYNQGQYEKAVKIFKELCSLDHLNYLYFYGLGASLHKLKKYKDALEAYSLASLLDDQSPLMDFHAADCCLNLGDEECALEYLEEALERAGESKEFAILKQKALLMKAQLTSKTKHKKEAK